jgi:glycosyltransferase involved in cell wall biosynthesis
MDISIIIATLNEEQYLKDTLESLHDQKTDKDFEIILGDGKSTDGTVDIAKEYGCKIATVEPGNIAIGRQAAALMSKGKMIVSADADSDYPSNWLEELTRPLMQKDVVATCGKILPAEGTKVEEVFAEKILNNIASLTYLVKIPFAAASNMAVDKKAFDRIGGYDTSLLTAEDTDLMKRMMKVGKVAYCPNAICYVSMRRVRQWGYAKYLSFHTKNFIKSHIGSKVFSTYEPIR